MTEEKITLIDKKTNDLVRKRWAKWNTYKTFPSTHIRSVTKPKDQ